MERSLHRFVRLLRLRGVRVSVTEALDAIRAAAVPGALADRETLRCALRVALVKDRRDQELFDELFDRYFRLEPVSALVGHEHSHGHEDLADQGTAESFTISPEPSQTPQQGHSHGKPADIREFFRPEDLATAYNARGYVYLLKRDYEHALADFNDAIRLKPDYANAFQNRAIAQKALDKSAANR